jgi:hypothetical protein
MPKATSDLDFATQRKQLEDAQKKLRKEIIEKRAAHTRFRISFDKANRNLQLVEGETMGLIRTALMQEPEALVVPGPGGSSEQWFWTVLKDRLRRHPAVTTATEAMLKAQEDAIIAEQEVLDLSDEWGMLRDHARMLAAHMQYSAAEV